MLLPKKVQHRKWHKGRRRQKGVATRINHISFGDFGLKSESFGWITSRQIEAVRRVLTRYVRRGGKVWVRIFPDKPMTDHGNESVMGSGKGAVSHFVAVVKKGRILFEMDGITEVQAREAMRLAAHKLPVKTKFLIKA
jgi:large subunit ribosomal protein L16